jgi:hypothetical protein
MRKYIDPTVKDLKVICTKLNISLESSLWRVFNDRRGTNGQRIKLPVKLTFYQMSLLERELIAKFPAHSFAIGNILWNCHYFQDSRKIVTAIHVYRNNELYDKLFPEKKEPVILSYADIAKLAGCDVNQLYIKQRGSTSLIYV